MDAKNSAIDREVSKCFNPRARDGREAIHLPLLALALVSIHAPVMDANTILITTIATQRFNPRARDGRERNTALIKSLSDVSIHAPVMDAKQMQKSVWLI